MAGIVGSRPDEETRLPVRSDRALAALPATAGAQALLGLAADRPPTVPQTVTTPTKAPTSQLGDGGLNTAETIGLVRLRHRTDRRDRGDHRHRRTPQGTGRRPEDLGGETASLHRHRQIKATAPGEGPRGQGAAQEEPPARAEASARREDQRRRDRAPAGDLDAVGLARDVAQTAVADQRRRSAAVEVDRRLRRRAPTSSVDELGDRQSAVAGPSARRTRRRAACRRRSRPAPRADAARR